MSRTARDARRSALAQNFIVDERALRTLLDAVPLDAARDVVVDLGAGRGAVTAQLAPRAARVLAVERDPAWAHELRTRAAREWRNVEVVEGDARAVAFPSAPFKVVANLPFNAGTGLVRRLLADGHGLAGAAVVLQLEAARRLAGGGRFGATWAPWFELAVGARIPARAFRPVPRVDAAVLTVRARQPALLSPAAFAAHAQLVDKVFAASGQTVAARLQRAVGRRRAARMLDAAALEPRATLGDVAPEVWARLTRVA
ncbi:ribosomal RNA small subunit methyltransferase A [Conexibacter woesei]|uniref:rRNA (Adenine-N(6)-)-methyltransferase n=1 Tax=Conexibacter woesei (strain DSM 14684 / CCUG 47730 / CIP 108061 / JCM 11494 / NBRC 100937 / ID131577) TaxID=469383 RepID=D3F754_CONWI|nr:rRNA adenine N(6)-methyltransferase family protein [Conexibacter woesei]ADB48825.1 rRNA (adenine-N(6)-)-methyltransferase [Conexibacter woesei DSM 14684]